MDCATSSFYTTTITTYNGVKTILRQLVNTCFKNESANGQVARGCFYFTEVAANWRAGSLKIQSLAPIGARAVTKKSMPRHLASTYFKFKTGADNLANHHFIKTGSAANWRKGLSKKTGLPLISGEHFLKSTACRQLAEGHIFKTQPSANWREAVLTIKTAKINTSNHLTPIQ